MCARLDGVLLKQSTANWNTCCCSYWFLSIRSWLMDNSRGIIYACARRNRPLAAKSFCTRSCLGTCAWQILMPLIEYFSMFGRLDFVFHAPIVKCIDSHHTWYMRFASSVEQSFHYLFSHHTWIGLIESADLKSSMKYWWLRFHNCHMHIEWYNRWYNCSSVTKRISIFKRWPQMNQKLEKKLW